MIKENDIESITKAVESDAGEDLPELRESLKEMIDGKQGRTYTPEQILVRSARAKLGLSQSKFAKLINTSVSSVQDWEQGRFNPPGAVQLLLRIALKHPDVVMELAA